MWDEKFNRPTLQYNAGLGFYRAALVEFASLISGGYPVIDRCANCGRWIFPGERMRAPKRGQKAYCAQCKNARAKFSMKKIRKVRLPAPI